MSFRWQPVETGFGQRKGGTDMGLFESLRTLGLESTGSHIAAKHFLAVMSREMPIVLHEDFQDALRGDARDGGRLIIVPSAFAGANTFFMDARLEVIGCFCHDTPPYHLAWRSGEGGVFGGSGSAQPESGPLIASHPAPVDLIPRILPVGSRYRVAHRRSTAAAARAVLTREADMALCNLATIEELGLEHSTTGIVIQMTWNVFAQRGRKA